MHVKNFIQCDRNADVDEDNQDDNTVKTCVKQPLKK